MPDMCIYFVNNSTQNFVLTQLLVSLHAVCIDTNIRALFL